MSVRVHQLVEIKCGINLNEVLGKQGSCSSLMHLESLWLVDWLIWASAL